MDLFRSCLCFSFVSFTLLSLVYYNSSLSRSFSLFVSLRLSLSLFLPSRLFVCVTILLCYLCLSLVFTCACLCSTNYSTILALHFYFPLSISKQLVSCIMIFFNLCSSVLSSSPLTTCFFFTSCGVRMAKPP
jgi:hypothetical protein